jgi:hypothetical protein
MRADRKFIDGLNFRAESAVDGRHAATLEENGMDR